ncbi:hypothetical protein Hanom_Chr04g00335601 [Helianthus anomalus]
MKAIMNTRIPTSESRIGANISHQFVSSSVSSQASTYVSFITSEYVHMDSYNNIKRWVGFLSPIHQY